MATRLSHERPLKREITIDGKEYVVAIDPTGFRISLKRHRSGVMMTWGEAMEAGTRDAEARAKGAADRDVAAR